MITRICLFMLLVWTSLLYGYETSFKSDSLHGALGDIISFTWEIGHHKDMEASLGHYELEGTGIEVLSQDLLTSKSGSELRFNTAIYDSVGYYQFPSIPVYLQGDGVEDSLLLAGPVLQIISILTPADTTFHDIKGLHKISTGINLLVLVILLAFLILAYVLYRAYLRYKQNREEMDSITIIPPDMAHEIALRDLKKLADSKYVRYAQFKEYFSELTHILKQYYENRFLIEALEQTSSELVTVMESMDEFDEKIIEETRKLLTKADLIKFAKRESSELESGQAINTVFEIVKSTKIEIPTEEDTPSKA